MKKKFELQIFHFGGWMTTIDSTTEGWNCESTSARVFAENGNLNEVKSQIVYGELFEMNWNFHVDDDEMKRRKLYKHIYLHLPLV